MAKFNIEIEIDWIAEGNDLNDEIKQGVIREVTRLATEKVLSGIVKESNEKLLTEIEARVDEAYQKIIAAPIQITDDWGSIKQSYPSLDDAVKAKFAAYLTEKVKKYDGTPSRHGDMTRLNYLIKKRIEDHSKQFMKTSIEEIESKIKQTIDESLKEHLGNKISEMVDIKGMIASQKKLK